jgi:geranylgeranyl diphosphate synthase type I
VRAYLAADDFAAAIEPAVLREAAAAYLERGGKGLRPALVLMCCGAVGGREEWALAAGAAAEVTHNWTLVHDDVIDRDELRRGGPTVHAAQAARGREEFGLGEEAARHYGLTMALLAGDLGPCWAAHLLARLPENGATDAATAWRLATELAAVTVPAVLAGEAEDVRLAVTPLGAVTVEAVEAMLAQKTGALYEWCARAGAAVGGAPPAMVAALGRFARACGVAFQHVDDTLPYFADEGTVGKAAASDLREGKRTAAVLEAYRRAGGRDREFIAGALGRADATAEELEELKGKITALGGVAFARARAQSWRAEALRELRLLPAGEGRDLLAAWAEFLVVRTY